MDEVNLSEKIVKTAIDISTTTTRSYDQVLHSLLYVTGLIGAHTCAEALEAERDDLRARVVKLERVLGMVEWGDVYDTERCIWCHGVRDNYPYHVDENDRGHKENCPRQKALY